jgi:hypothetical protein
MGEKKREVITIESVVETDKKYNYKCQRERSGANSMVTQGITIRLCCQN